MIVAQFSGKQIDNSDRRANIRYVQSSNIDWIGWPQDGEPLMLVCFKDGSIYGYYPVTRQRAVAAALSPSPGRYINKIIKSKYEAVRIKQW